MTEISKSLLQKSIDKYLSRRQFDPATDENTLFVIDKSPQYKKFFHEDNAFINQIYQVSDGWQGIDYQGKKFKLIIINSERHFHKIKQSKFTDYCIMANYDWSFNIKICDILEDSITRLKTYKN